MASRMKVWWFSRWLRFSPTFERAANALARTNNARAAAALAEKITHPVKSVTTPRSDEDDVVSFPELPELYAALESMTVNCLVDALDYATGKTGKIMIDAVFKKFDHEVVRYIEFRRDQQREHAIELLLTRLERNRCPWAARALGELRVVEARDRLIKLVADKNAVLRHAVVASLGDLADVICVDSLLPVLDDSDISIRAQAARSLGKTMDLRCLPPLLRLLNASESVLREAAAAGIEYLGHNPANRDVLTGTATVPLISILEKRDENDSVRAAAIRALRQLSDPRSKDALLAALREKRPFLGSKIGDHPVADSAAEALGSLGDISVVEPLIDFLNDEQTHWRSSSAIASIEALGRLGDPRSVAALIRKLSADNEATEVAAAEALGKIGDRKAVAPLIERLKWTRRTSYRSCQSRQRHRQCVIALALARIGDKQAAEPLSATLNEADDVVLRQVLTYAIEQLTRNDA